MLARVNCGNCHKILLVVIDDLHICRTRRPCGPLEADPPLVIDANAVLSLSVALQRFEPVVRQCTEIPKLDSCFQAIQFESCGALNSRERFDPLTSCKISGPRVSVADDHA